MMRISSKVTAMATVAVVPRSSGLKAPRRPAMKVESRMYVTSAMVGIYMSGEFTSSRGGWYSSAAEAEGSGACRCWRDQGRCHHGIRMMRSLVRT